MVILRNDVDKTNIQILYNVIKNYTLENGVVANVLSCTEVESGGAYLNVVAELVSGKGVVDMQLPHWLILTILGSKNRPPVGFVWGVETHEQSKPLE